MTKINCSFPHMFLKPCGAYDGDGSAEKDNKHNKDDDNEPEQTMRMMMQDDDDNECPNAKDWRNHSLLQLDVVTVFSQAWFCNEALAHPGTMDVFCRW